MIAFDFNFISLNEYINTERANRFKTALIKKTQTDNCCYFAKLSKLKFIEKVDVKFTWYTPNNRKDHDNISFAKKFILDGLVKAGVLINDNPKYVGNFIDNFEIDKTKDYTYCIVEFILITK